MNNHYLKECNKKHNFVLCYKCKEAIPRTYFKDHIQENTCTSGKNINYYNRCPLCHSDNTPSGVLGWQMHLLEDGCPCNNSNVI